MSYTKDTMDIGATAMAMMGVGNITYIRPVKNDEGYAVYGADGTQLAIFPNYDAAYSTARQFNLVPVSVH